MRRHVDGREAGDANGGHRGEERISERGDTAFRGSEGEREYRRQDKHEAREDNEGKTSRG